jgi:hypothetical protein
MSEILILLGSKDFKNQNPGDVKNRRHKEDI